MFFLLEASLFDVHGAKDCGRKKKKLYASVLLLPTPFEFIANNQLA